MLPNHAGGARRLSEAESKTYRWMAEGYRPGAPEHIPDATQIDNAVICRSLRCPSCLRRGLQYKPFQRGRSYRVLGVCGFCGSCEEV